VAEISKQTIRTIYRKFDKITIFEDKKIGTAVYLRLKEEEQ
jgi:hypothetical protein